MLKTIGTCAICLMAHLAFAQEPAAGKEQPKTDEAATKAAPAQSAAATDEKDKEFKPPPGFKTKKRGDQVLYCQRDATVGTRFKTEKCYNEEQLRTYIMVTEAQRRDMDRIRTNCGGGPCTPLEPGMPAR